jgi:5'-nucleotidase
MNRVVRPPRPRRVFCNRTLSLRGLGAVGFDMDYTLVHYHTERWEGAAFRHARDLLAERGWPIDALVFDASAFTRGLVLDLELGNVVKPNRFGYPKRASHGTRMLDWPVARATYERTFVDLRDRRWVFLNTMFSLSEVCLYAQGVDAFDRGLLPGVRSYAGVYEVVAEVLGRVHTEGYVKDDVLADPEAYVDVDPELPLALLDLKESGKRLVLATNSDWLYTKAMMEHAIDPGLGGSWRDLFHLVVVAARKPAFFTQDSPLYEVVDEARGLLAPASGGLRPGPVWHGGTAAQVEAALGLDGESILYVGDHVFSDVNVSKKLLRWRTALVVRELEQELDAEDAFEAQMRQIASWMGEKEALEAELSHLRLDRQRTVGSYGPRSGRDVAAIDAEIRATRDRLVDLDGRIAPLADAQSRLGNAVWGPLFRAGNDKSHFARQVERYADLYLSRVSNLLYATPYEHLRSPRGTLPHDDPWGGT